VATDTSRATCDTLRNTSCVALGAAAGGDPIEETFHAGALAPHQREEFRGVEIGGFVAEEGFHAPLNVGRGPGTEAVAFGDDPVVAKGVQHVAFNSNARVDGRIGAGATEVEAIKLGAMRGR
jgi:hypothetical protein